ncbi:hypothetical protein I3843_03G068200 [Carya illinoinensis]|uniref:Protein kinase domain-containing protein n=1 Tax=Carya illinoinensis TaxID=32201 RepID=A0A8T1QXY3_CARIL|nr:probable inactive receptor kinase At1g48480 [Carya illinoinensis]KAG2715176.1 hypothetical protein I3760_03G065500 [Carya illinoinensis]KAG6659968.1 hypothetical protein CIPAW_03G072800 [Carya illinoinensis]KAG6720542.1 hypothetical protein I3842_03G067800 [Carya illinoinensis]KAG7986179.1 hypothetical protein I3843_03G068200 [Carya illinoinensis]
MEQVQVRDRPIFLLFVLSICSSVLTCGASDLSSDRAALLTLRQAVRGRLLRWNISVENPCKWNGVNCSNNRVTELRFPAMGLLGPLPVGIGNLTQLVTLSLRVNSLSGPIPPDLANLAQLRNLYLQQNHFSGEIPESLYNLKSLVRVNLAYNNFSGEISPRINNLTRLGTLFLEENNLTGSIPDIDIAPLPQFNVSFNRLNGPVPQRLSGLPANSFEGNSLCGKPLQACPGSGNRRKLSGGAIAGIVIGSFLGFALIVLILILFCRRKSGGQSNEVAVAKRGGVEIPREKAALDSESMGASAEHSRGSKRRGGSKRLVFFGNVAKTFDLEDLLRASAEVLGKGTFGTAYKATLGKGMTVVVKRLKEVTLSDKEFRERIEQIGSMAHVNLVTLRGYYFNTEETLLVYDYVPLGSISALLHGNRGSGRTPLNWETRTGIALGAARAIGFLHSHGPTISHGNIKSSNILLSSSYEARVSDFGLASLALPTSTPNRINGYRAPEVTDARNVSQKADVYSFGVLLLELLTGKPPTHALLNEEGVDLPRWVQSVVYEEWTSEVFDPELLRYQSVEEEMVQLLQIGLECTAQYPDRRPSMAEVTKRIEEMCLISSSQQEQGTTRDLSTDVDEGLSPRLQSVDSRAPSSS